MNIGTLKGRDQPAPHPKYYAGIGSRETPEDVMNLMTRLAVRLGVNGWTLRSGGARGADSAFERGCELADTPKEVFTAQSVPDWCFPIAENHHPAWQACSDFAKKLHARNVQQILGRHQGDKHSSFVVCWTPDGACTGRGTTRATGGTGQAIRIANYYSVNVFNLQRPDHRGRITTWLDR